MLKVEHSIDYLKKERVDPQANELLSKEQLKRQSVLKRIKRANISQDDIKSFTAPRDGSCFFWSVALAYLIPVKDDEQSFSGRYRNLFGDDSDQQFNYNYNQRFGHPPNVLAKEAEVRNFFQNYNPLYDDLENNSLKELIRRVFRNRVVDYVSSNQEHLLVHIPKQNEREQYIENMRIDSSDIQSWADNPEINAVMERFNIDLDITGRYLDRSIVGRGNDNNVERVSISLSYVNNNHYNYHIDQDIARGYYDKLLKDSFRILKTSSENDPVPFSGDSEMPLTKKDIINIADIEYDWSLEDSREVIFDVVETNELFRKCDSQLLGKVREDNKPLVYIVDLGSSHWVTLVIVYRDEQFFAYYIDPLGDKVTDKIKEHLEEKNIHCPNIEVKQTDFNTGIFALKNLEVIFKGKRSTQKVILEQRPSFSTGINAELEKMKPPKKNGQGLKGEIDKNDKYKRVGYDDLENPLDSLCSQLKRDKNGETTFIILSGNTHEVILTVGFRDEQVVACYVANGNTKTADIEDLLSKKGIVQIFARDDISALLSKFNNDIELFILQSAKVVTNYFNNHDYITLANNELKKGVSEKEIEGVINRLKARNKIEDKIVRCKSEIDKYIKQYSDNPKQNRDFTEAQANLFTLFLESIALEDTELSRFLGERLKRVRTRIMGDEDFKVIDIIRSKNLVHRSGSNINTIIECKDINKFIKDGVSRDKFFRGLQTYLNQIINKLNRKTIDSTHEIKVDSFFKTEGEIEKISYKVKTEEEIKEYLSNSFRKLVNTNSYSSKDRQMIMFELVVNVIPLLEGLYGDGDKDKKLKIEELRNIQKEKNELIHKFHTYSSEPARKFELKKFIDKIKPTFFKYIYSQKIYELLKGSILQLLKDTIELKFKNSLREFLKDFNYVADEFGDQNKAVTFQSIASMLEPSTSSEDSLGNFISNYVKLMHLIDNEDEIQKRKKKGPSLPQRYDQLTDNYDRLSDMRLYLYEHFNLLKQLYLKGSSYEYKLIEEQFAKQLKKKCGILKPSFESIVDLYVKGGNSINGDQFIQRIYNDINTVSAIKEKGKDLKISDIIESYGKRESLQAKKGSTEEKFKSIPKGEIVNINGVDVSTDRFVVNILKLFDSIASQYKNVFNNVEEAFNDETFLSFLTHNNINFSSQVWDKLLRINYLSPYIVELIVRDQLNDQSGLISRGLVNPDTLDKIIEKLLESDLYATHIKKLLSLDKDKLLKIFSTQNQSLGSNGLELYKIVCQKLNVNSIGNIYNLLKDETHAIPILNKLSEKIITNNGLDPQKIDLAKEILRLLDNISEELIYEKDYKKLHKILSIKGVNDFINKLDSSDLYGLKIRRRIAVIKNEKDDEYDTAQRILEDIKNKIQNGVQEDKQSFFLLVSSDIAYTKHLKQEYKEAYEEYEALYKKMIELSLHRSINDWSKFYLVDTYNKVIESQKYVSILKYSPKYLDILKIRSDMAYELRSLADKKRNSLPDKGSKDYRMKLNEVLQHYQDALGIYEEVYEIKAAEVLGQDIVKDIRDIAYVNNKLAKLKLSSSQLSESLSHYDKAFEMYNRVLRIQEKEQWENHPANSKTIQDIIQAMHNVAYVNNRLGSSNNPEEALEHHKKALEIYQQVYEFQKGSLGEEHEYTLKTKKSVSYTHNQLAHLYDKVGNIDEAISHCRANLVLLEVNNEEYKKARSFLDKLTLDKQNPTLPSLQKCLKGRKKRNAEGECLFTWEDVDKFNAEKDEKRDFSKIKIDSEKFLNYIRNLPQEKQSQLIQLASETGSAQGLVSKLVSNQKVMSHLSMVGKISGMTMHGMMAKNVLADFLNGNYQGVAINVGFIAGGQGFAKVAEAASLKGLKLAEEGKLLVGSSLKAASPFLARGTSAFVVYDLVNQIKAFKNGTEEALVGVVGDSIYLGVDAAEIGVEVAEGFGVLEGVSSVTGPIGATIGAVVFVGTDIYMAVKRVDKIDQLIHLTGNEKFIEGLRAFIGIKPEQYIEELMEKKQLYNQLVKQGLEYLKQHSDIQSYVFPTTDSKFKPDLDNKVLLDRKRTDVKWSRAKPDNPDGGQVFCLPQGDYEPAPNYGSYLCESAIGVTDLSANKTGGYTLINLGEGKDNVKGFTDSRNIFVVNNGSKEYYGGNKDDIFVLQAGYVKGYLSGEGGINTLDTTSFAFQEEPLNIQLDIGEIVDYSRDNWLRVCDINKVIGRENRAETITVSCNGCNSNVKLIDGQSGNKEIKDKINIVDNHCSYQMQVIVRPNTVIYNRALEGNFDYLVPLNEGGSAEFIFIFGPERFNVNNTFWFEYEPVDIKSINVRYVNIFNRTEHEIKFNFIKSEKEFNVTIPYAENPSYRLGKSVKIRIGNKGNLYMLESTNKSSEEVIRDYLPVANRVSKMSFFIQSLLSNETVVIGSGNHEVIHNNPAYRNHLVGNGGENVYVIDSETTEVIIHDIDEENSIDTIDLRNLVRQVRGKLSNQDNFQLKVLKSANDLLLKATVVEVKPTEDSSVSKMRKHEYCTVRLKDGVNWYNKTHVIVDNAPMKINLDNNEWSLKPLPLKFEKDKEVIIVTSQDIEENTELITPKRAGNYSFVSDHGNDLIVTNAFDVNVAKNDLCTIVLSKFYEKPKMATLSIKFADKEIILKEHQEEISTARDVNVVKKEHKDQVYNGVFNHTKSSPEVIMLSDQPVTHRHRHSRHREQTRHRRSTSSGIRPTGWINDLFGWVRSSISGLLSSKPESTPSSISQVDARVDVNGTIMLLDVFIRKVTGQKYVSTVDHSISPLEAQGYALNITKGFEKVVEQARLKSGVSMHRLNIDYMGMQKEITRKVMSGKFNEISGILSSYVEKACPDGEAGKLSPKKFDKFMIEFNKGLDVTLNQSIEQILHNGDGRLEVDGVKEQKTNSGPQSYLSNASVQGHLTRNKVKLIS